MPNTPGEIIPGEIADAIANQIALYQSALALSQKQTEQALKVYDRIVATAGTVGTVVTGKQQKLEARQAWDQSRRRALTLARRLDALNTVARFLGQQIARTRAAAFALSQSTADAGEIGNWLTAERSAIWEQS